MKQRLLEIIAQARAEGLDPVELLLDYFREKDDYRMTRADIERLIVRWTTQEDERPTPPPPGR